MSNLEGWRMEKTCLVVGDIMDRLVHWLELFFLSPAPVVCVEGGEDYVGKQEMLKTGLVGVITNKVQLKHSCMMFLLAMVTKLMFCNLSS